MISAVESYLRDWLRVLYWVFFKPTALPNHVREIVPQRAAERVFVTEFMRICATHRELRRFFVETVVNTALTSFMVSLILMTLIFVIAAAFGNDVDWNFGLKDVAKVAASGVAVFVAFGVAFGVMDSVMVGLTLGVASGVSRFVAVSVTFGVVGGVTFGVVGGIAGVAGVLGSVAENVAAAMVGGVAFGVITSVMSGAVRVMGVALGVINGVNFGVELGVAVGLIASVAWGLGAMRLPFYLLRSCPLFSSTDAARAAGRLSVNYGARRSTSMIY